jgi:hypothetical protein
MITMRSLILTLTLALAVTATAQDTLPALLTDKPASENRDKLMLFGQFIGSWSYEGVDYHDDGSRTTNKGQIHFHWVLEGRAIQDVWMETNGSGVPPEAYGTTIRFYDPKTDSWKVTWINPGTGVVYPMIGRQIGSEIVMEATNRNGTLIHWIFSDIKPDSFHWRGEKLVDKQWRVYEEVFAKKMN